MKRRNKTYRQATPHGGSNGQGVAVQLNAYWDGQITEPPSCYVNHAPGPTYRHGASPLASDLRKVMMNRMKHGGASVYYPVSSSQVVEPDGSGLTPGISPLNLCWSANPILGYSELHNVNALTEQSHELAPVYGNYSSKGL